MLVDEDSQPMPEAIEKQEQQRVRLLTFCTNGERLVRAFQPVSCNVHRSSVLAHFAAMLVQGCDVLSPLVRGLLQSHYMVASAIRGLVQLLVLCEAQHVEHETESRVSVTSLLFNEFDQFIEETLCIDERVQRIPVMLFLFYGWVIPMAARYQHNSLLQGCVALCHLCAAIIAQKDAPALPIPQTAYGFNIDAFAKRARRAAMDTLWGPSQGYTGPRPTELPMYSMAVAEETHLAISSVLQPRVHGRLNAQMHRFLASPVRAPLPFPPFESRADENGNAIAIEFDVSGKAAVRESCGNSPVQLNLALLPPCVARSIWLSTPQASGGGMSGADGVWSNDDRYHMATFFQDAGEFPIEDMHHFFADRLSLAGTAGDQQRRIRHAMIHVRSHSNKIDGKRSRGEPPYVTPTCKTMARTGVMSDRRSFRCPFTPEGAFTTERENELRTVLTWQGLSEDGIVDVLAEARVGNQAPACLAAFKGLAPAGRAAARKKPFTYPHFFSYFMAFASKQDPALETTVNSINR